MGGIHRSGVRITLNSLITKQTNLLKRACAMFARYAKNCNHYKSTNKCEHPGNKYHSDKSRHYMCDMYRCPDRGKI